MHILMSFIIVRVNGSRICGGVTLDRYENFEMKHDLSRTIACWRYSFPNNVIAWRVCLASSILLWINLLWNSISFEIDDPSKIIPSVVVLTLCKVVDFSNSIISIISWLLEKMVDFS